MQHHIARRWLRVSAEIESMPSTVGQINQVWPVLGSLTVVQVDSTEVHVCGLHGATMDPQRLVGRTMASAVASWHYYASNPADGPVDIWLIDDQRTSTHITTGSDWCLLVEEKAPFDGYDMDEYGRIEVRPIDDTTPLAPHIGGAILAVREELHPLTGRVALELAFGGGWVRCDGLDGDLRLTAIEAGPSAR